LLAPINWENTMNVEQAAAKRGIDITKALKNLRAHLTRRAKAPGPTPYFPGVASRRWESPGNDEKAKLQFCNTYTAEVAQHDLLRIHAAPDPVAEYVRTYEIRNHLKRTTR
jgi:hypothetical protein